MKTLLQHESLPIPESVAVCPICGAKLVAQFQCWQERDDKTWEAAEIDLNCVTEPDIDSRQWWPWHRRHYAMPYVDWLPLDVKLLAWVNENYRFVMDADEKAYKQPAPEWARLE